jgi:hypothetical protein
VNLLTESTRLARATGAQQEKRRFRQVQTACKQRHQYDGKNDGEVREGCRDSVTAANKDCKAIRRGPRIYATGTANVAAFGVV